MGIRDDIDDFLRQTRLAVIGVSRNERDFTRALFREFVKRGYDAVPVNPASEAIEGRPCFHRAQDISPAVQGALLLTPPARTEAVAMDCVAAGIPRIWMYRAVGKGAVSSRAVAFCKSRGVRVIPGYCPYMFWEDAPFFHRLHGFFVKLSI
ncbi:MAG: CoA-binding protein [Bryobacterales bacterium]|nr:CoA-binding protein [Bryobacterales bacterium]